MRQNVPAAITRGERVEWSRAFAGYPPDRFALEYRFRGPGTGINVTATANGSEFLAVIDPSQTELLQPGRYQWQAWMTEIAAPTNVYLADHGEVTIRPGFAAADTGDIDLRSTAERIVEALEAALLNSATREHLEYEISTPAGARKIKFMTRREQQEFLKFYKEIVARERAAERAKRTGKFGTTVLINVRSDG